MVYSLYTRQFAFVNAYRMFLSAHSDGAYWALVVYWDKQQGTTHERDVLLKLEQFVSDSDEGAIQLATDWASKKFNMDVEFMEI